ncbi:hypothetical protein CBFG_02929 [Clostridiales bacterium 1_7_47FAA]|nr:hypothetical protein CBFG_02929 [Clostridiales bacterium 1_7_47FAA]
MMGDMIVRNIGGYLQKRLGRHHSLDEIMTTLRKSMSRFHT